MNLAACDEIGQRQDGLITRRQILKVLSRSQLESLIEAKALSPLVPTVYRMTGVPATWERLIRAATLANPGRVLASRQTAAYLWGLLERQPKTVEVVTQVGRSPRMPGVKVHRTRSWHDLMAVEVHGILITSPARTIIDMSCQCSKETLKKAIDRSITSGIMTLDDIIDELERIGSRGRSRCSLLYKVLAKRDKRFAKCRVETEVNVLDWIRDAGLPLPEPEYRIAVGPDDTYIPDFYYIDQRIVVEVQSWKWHGGPSKFEQDGKRSLVLATMGIQILPVIPRKSHKAVFIKALTRKLAAA